MIFSRWDVVAVHFPFIEGFEAKRRPALIVSADRLRDEHGVYWAAMITTAKAGQRSRDISVTNPEQAGLPQDCVIRVPRLVTIQERQIARRLGEITQKDRAAVSALLRLYLP